MAIISAFSLLLLISGCFAITVSKTFHVSNICDVPYGIVMYTGTQRTTLACSNMCAKNVSCVSFIYHPVTRMCTTNMAGIPQPFINCTFLVKYGLKSASPSSTATNSPTTLTTATPTGPSLVSFNGESCIANIDCVELLSECRDAICQCVEGYVYDYTVYTCVFITDCAQYGSTFQTISEREHLGVPIVTETISEALCISQCVTATNYICHLISYDRNQQTCTIFDFTGVSMQAITSGYDPEANSIVYQRDCNRLASTMHGSCWSNDQCHDRNSECQNLDSRCSCQIGLSYNVEKRACVKECSLYAYYQQHQEYLSMTVVGFLNDTEQFPIYNAVECNDACDSNGIVDCVSAMVSFPESICYISRQTLGIYPPENIVSSPSFVLIQKDCQPLRAPMEDMYCYNAPGVCTVTDSECRDGVCKCLIGLSYRSSSNTCTDICASYGNTFQTINDLHVLGMGMVVLPMLSNDKAAECKVVCAKETSFTCKMAVLNVLTAECALYNVNLGNFPTNEHVSGPDYVTFQRDCL